MGIGLRAAYIGGCRSIIGSRVYKGAGLRVCWGLKCLKNLRV